MTSRLTPEREAQLRQLGLFRLDEVLDELAAVRGELAQMARDCTRIAAQKRVCEDEFTKVHAQRAALLVATNRFIANYPWQMAPELQELQAAISRVKP